MDKDWVKMRTSLSNDNRVLRMIWELSDPEHQIQAALRAENPSMDSEISLPDSLLRVTVIGALCVVWGQIRHQGLPLPGGDCLLEHANQFAIDTISGIGGFGETMVKVGWCHEEEEGLLFPEFFNEFNTIPKPGKLTNAEKSRRCRERKKAREGFRYQSVTKTDTPIGTEKEKEKENKDIEVPNGTSRSDSPKSGNLTAKRNNCPYQQIVDLYHEMLPELPRIEKLTKTRKGFLKQRWQEDLTELGHWKNYFSDVRQSKFLMGKSQPTGDKPPFIANLEWLTRPSNFVKVAEGNYHRRK